VAVNDRRRPMREAIHTYSPAPWHALCNRETILEMAVNGSREREKKGVEETSKEQKASKNDMSMRNPDRAGQSAW